MDLAPAMRCFVSQIPRGAQLVAGFRCYLVSFLDWLTLLAMLLALATFVPQGGRQSNQYQLFSLDRVDSQIVLLVLLAILMQVSTGAEQAL